MWLCHNEIIYISQELQLNTYKGKKQTVAYFFNSSINVCPDLQRISLLLLLKKSEPDTKSSQISRSRNLNSWN